MVETFLILLTSSSMSHLKSLYEVVEGRISARDGSTIINRERVEADVEKLQRHIDTPSVD